MKQTRIKQLLGSRSLCRHKAIWSHYLCILKQLTLLPVLLLSFYVQKKKIQTCSSQFKDPFESGNKQCHILWAEIKERNQGGDWEIWWPRRIVFTVERPNQDPTQTLRGKPVMDFPLLPSSPVAQDVQISCRKQKMNGAISTQPLHHKDKARFVLVCFSVCVLGKLGP